MIPKCVTCGVDLHVLEYGQANCDRCDREGALDKALLQVAEGQPNEASILFEELITRGLVRFDMPWHFTLTPEGQERLGKL